MSEEKQIPEGYLQNAQGHLVPIDQVRENDLLRDDLVKGLVEKAYALNKALAEFKQLALADIADLIAVSAEKYGVHIGGKKGNVSLLSYDGKLKIIRSQRDVISFTQEIEAAKALIDKCLARWTENSDVNLKVIVDQAFRTNRKDEIKTGKVLELMRLKIDDADWNRAMEALKDAMLTTHSSTYVRVYRRVGDSEEWEPIPLDLASVEVPTDKNQE